MAEHKILCDLEITEQNLAVESSDPRTPIGKYAKWLLKYNVDLTAFLPKKTKHFVN